LATPIPPDSGNNDQFAFEHVLKHDGTSDSICLRCHAIVASSHNEASLEQAERAHICPARPSAPQDPLPPQQSE
jgi:hypothetical protein